MSFFLEEEVEVDFDFDYRQIAEKVINYCIEREKFPYEAEINLTLTDNEGIHIINKEYRDIDRATDVLSFPMLSYESPGIFDDDNITDDCFDPDTGELILGDIVLSVDKIYEQAESYGHSTKRELAFLVAHSMLHLFGYDHMEEDEMRIMEEKQREILDKLGITRD